MTANKFAAIRYKIIHSKLSKRFPDYPSKEDLRLACEDFLYGSTGERVSTSTIEKDLEAMRYESMLGYEAPITYSHTHRGYYYDDPDYQPSGLFLREEELEAMQFAVGILQQFQDMEICEQFAGAVEKIADVLNISAALEEQATTNEIIQFEKAHYFKGSHLLSDLALAIKNQRVVQLLHHAFYRETARAHILHPYLLKEFRNRWYVIGWHGEAQQIRIFGLDRIQQMDVMEEGQYRENTDFDADDFFEHVYGIFIGKGKPVKAVLSFTTEQGKYLKTKPLHHSQSVVKESEEELVLSYMVKLNYEFVNRILGYGTGVKVMGPPTLVKQVKEAIKLMAAQYR